MYRLGEGIERFFITDINNPAGSSQAQSFIPVYLDGLVDTKGANNNIVNKADTFNPLPGGCNVLYMDGHVEFVKYPGKYPANDFTATLVSAAAAVATRTRRKLTTPGAAAVNRSEPSINEKL